MRQRDIELDPTPPWPHRRAARVPDRWLRWQRVAPCSPPHPPAPGSWSGSSSGSWWSSTPTESSLSSPRGRGVCQNRLDRRSAGLEAVIRRIGDITRVARRWHGRGRGRIAARDGTRVRLFLRDVGVDAGQLVLEVVDGVLSRAQIILVGRLLRAVEVVVQRLSRTRWLPRSPTSTTVASRSDRSPGSATSCRAGSSCSRR